MNISEFKNMIIRSLDKDSDPEEMNRKIENAGVSFEFRPCFSDLVLEKIFAAKTTILRENEYVRNLMFAFNRIAITGIAAIVILLISIFLMEGSISFNSFFGLSNGYDESIVCLITGNY